MALVSFSEPIRFEIPHEPGEWMALQKPTSKAARAARRLVESDVRKNTQELGAEVLRALQDSGAKKEKDGPEPPAADPYRVDNFDRDTLLVSSIKAWSYGAPVSADTIADLDEATARWAHETVVGLMRPPTEQARKND